MSDVTVTLQQHHINAIIDARVRLTLLSQLGVDMTLICDALDEVVQMCVENRARDPKSPDNWPREHSVGLADDTHSVHWTRHD